MEGEGGLRKGLAGSNMWAGTRQGDDWESLVTLLLCSHLVQCPWHCKTVTPSSTSSATTPRVFRNSSQSGRSARRQTQNYHMTQKFCSRVYTPRNSKQVFKRHLVHYVQSSTNRHGPKGNNPMSTNRRLDKHNGGIHRTRCYPTTRAYVPKLHVGEA